MSDRPFFIYWNELSFPDAITAATLREGNVWRERAQTAFRALQQTFRVRKDCRVLFVKGVFHNHVADRPFQSWLEEWLGKDSYRQLRHKASQPVAVSVPVHDLECELVFAHRGGEGLTRAHLTETWVWSLGNPDTCCDGVQIDAEKTFIDSSEVLLVQVPNLAREEHVLHWTSQLETWGAVISPNYVLAQFDNYKVIMYPFDHGYAHVHVHTVAESGLNSKYRVDVFEALTDDSSHLRPEGLDTKMAAWIEVHREQLLISWKQCQRGANPLKLN